MMNRNNIYEGKGCLGEGQMHRYLTGGASAGEQKAMEQHLQQCGFCADALEGASMLPAGDFALGVKEIHQRTDKQLEEGNTKTLYPFTFKIAAAATILLFIGIGLFGLLKNQTTDLQETAAVLQDTSEPHFDEEIISLLSEQAQNEVMGNMEIRKREVPPPPALELEIPSDMDMPITTQQSVAHKQGVVMDIVEEEQAISLSAESVNKSEFNGRQRNQPPPTNAPTAITPYQQGLDLYHSGFYNDAIKYFEISGKGNPDFQKESRLYHTALAYIKLNNPQAAIPLLKQVVEMEGAYLQEAKEALKKLE